MNITTNFADYNLENTNNGRIQTLFLTGALKGTDLYGRVACYRAVKDWGEKILSDEEITNWVNTQIEEFETRMQNR